MTRLALGFTFASASHAIRPASTLSLATWQSTRSGSLTVASTTITGHDHLARISAILPARTRIEPQAAFLFLRAVAFETLGDEHRTNLLFEKIATLRRNRRARDRRPEEGQRETEEDSGNFLHSNRRQRWGWDNKNRSGRNASQSAAAVRCGCERLFRLSVRLIGHRRHSMSEGCASSQPRVRQ